MTQNKTMLTRKSSKEKMSNLFNRYVWLTDLIYRKRKVTFEEINEQWRNSELNYSGDNIPLKTFHNHRHAIEDIFDICIECDRRNGYVYYIDNSEDLKRRGVRQWLINTFAENNLISESRKLKHRILLEKIPSGQRYLSAIIEAMRDGMALELTYQSFGADEQQTITFEPYALKVFKQRWYVVGNNGKQVKIYSLDRISSLESSNKIYTLPTDFDCEEYFAASYGIINDSRIPVTEVRIKAKGIKAKYIATLPLHHSQVEIEKSENYTIYSYYLSPTYDFRQELLSHGAELIVLSPQWFRDEIAEIIKEQFKAYKLHL